MPISNNFRQLADSEKALHSTRFFKTGPGQYGEGDQFLGITVPEIRRFMKSCPPLSEKEIIHILKSPFHEERLLALLIMVKQYQKSSIETKNHLHQLYLDNTQFINNWDLVDCSAEYLVGQHLAKNAEQSTPKLLYQLAKSTSLWENRIAIIATFHYLKKGVAQPTLEISQLLLNHPHDLIHKAVGWMLREMGKRCGEKLLTDFLDQFTQKLPRTCLRYAIEKLPLEQRKHYLQFPRQQ